MKRFEINFSCPVCSQLKEVKAKTPKPLQPTLLSFTCKFCESEFLLEFSKPRNEEKKYIERDGKHFGSIGMVDLRWTFLNGSAQARLTLREKFSKEKENV